MVDEKCICFPSKNKVAGYFPSVTNNALAPSSKRISAATKRSDLFVVIKSSSLFIFINGLNFKDLIKGSPVYQ